MKFQPSTPQKLTLDQIVEILAADRDGIRVQLTAEKLGVKSGTIYAWIARYSGLDAKGFHLVRKIERENKRLRSDVARAEARSRIAIEVIKQLEPSSRRRAWMTPHLQMHFAVDRKLANEVLSIGADATGRRPLPLPTEHLVTMMKHYLSENPGHGLATMYQAVLRGTPGGIARARKAYHEAGLSVRQRTQRKAKLPQRVLRPMEIQGGPDRVWSMDFMLHTLSDGTPFRILNVIDDFNREAIACRALLTHTTIEVVEALDQVANLGRLPGCIRTDNGTEFKSLAYRNWTDGHDVSREYSRPYHCTDNAYIESFNGILRKEVLRCYDFDDLVVVQRMLDDWRKRYNLSRPHFALGGLSPLQYAYAAAEGRAPALGRRYSQRNADFVVPVVAAIRGLAIAAL